MVWNNYASSMVAPLGYGVGGGAANSLSRKKSKFSLKKTIQEKSEKYRRLFSEKNFPNFSIFPEFW
jgi:hypothetical protein